MRSGTIPYSVKGISTWGHNTESTPFYPCLELNLSPIIGFLGILTLYSTFTSYGLSPYTIATPSSLPASASYKHIYINIIIIFKNKII